MSGGRDSTARRPLQRALWIALSFGALHCSSDPSEGADNDAGADDGGTEASLDADAGVVAHDGGSASLDAGTSTAPDAGTSTPTDAGAPSIRCDRAVSPSGSDANAGTLASPWQHVQKAFDSASAGQTVCLRAGTYEPAGTFNTSAYRQTFSKAGTAGSPVVFVNYAGETAVVHGTTYLEGAYVTLESASGASGALVFEGPVGSAYNDVQVSVSGAHDVLLDHVEIRLNDHHAGLFANDCSNVTLSGCYIHDNGDFGDSVDGPSGGNTWNVDQGIYWDTSSGGGNTIENCVIAGNRAYGLQLYPAGSGVTIVNNTVVGNGNSGAIVSGGTNDAFMNNIFAFNGHTAGNPQLRFSSGSGNVFDTNLTWDPSASLQGVEDEESITLSNDIVMDPGFVNESGGDYHLTASSPAIGAGIQADQPALDRDGRTRSSADLGAYAAP